MSGHSKWAQIKRQKGVTDKKKGAAFAKLAKTISIAAKQGGDPAMNFTLRLAIDKAKEANMPKDNIDRAIKRGTGELDGVQIEEITYEGYGPAGVAILIETATDSRNRTTAELRHLLSLHGGNLGSSGGVQWMFERRGVLTVNKSSGSPEDITLAAIEAGAEDVETDENNIYIYTKPEQLMSTKTVLESQKISCASAEIEFHPTTTVLVPPGSPTEQLEKLMGELESHDDVTNYYTNAA